MLIGDIIAISAMRLGLNVTYFPSYGVEMRGGEAKCTIVISDKEIGSPIIGFPQCLIAMNRPSLLRYQNDMKNNGLLILNTSLVNENEIKRQDIEKILIPANEVAQKSGSSKIANMVMLGVFLEKTKIFDEELIYNSLKEVLSDKKQEIISSNIGAIKEGMKFIKGGE